jgi:hypothetical protein
MKKIIEIPMSDVRIDMPDVLQMQGIPSDKKASQKIVALFDKAEEFFCKHARPIGIISGISKPEFENVYYGEALNEKETPLDTIFRRADHLALFALTVGKEASRKITELFEAREFALASMLDATASVGVEKAADSVETIFFNLLTGQGEGTPAITIVRYSPGYCGWHISGQKKLFTFLHPEEIGITLLDSYLMKPLKSVSGVLVAGSREIHRFKDTYPFCTQCTTRSCRSRIEHITRTSAENRKRVD